MVSLKCAVLLVMFTVNLVGGYKILLFFPNPGKSHAILGEGYVRPLVDAGHDVSLIKLFVLFTFQ